MPIKRTTLWNNATKSNEYDDYEMTVEDRYYMDNQYYINSNSRYNLIDKAIRQKIKHK
jgi:hypothetical protein